jgi:hypothetical protein
MARLSGKAHPQYRHGGYTEHKGEYHVWAAMKTRCYNPKNVSYPYYGGRGIGVDKRWLGDEGFANFLADMKKRPDGYSLERIDCDKDYMPSNCKWIPLSDQSKNRRSVVLLTIDGITDTFSAHCRRYGIDKRVAHKRKSRGMDTITAITRPLNHPGVSFQEIV